MKIKKKANLWKLSSKFFISPGVSDKIELINTAAKINTFILNDFLI